MFQKEVILNFGLVNSLTIRDQLYLPFFMYLMITIIVVYHKVQHILAVSSRCLFLEPDVRPLDACRGPFL